MECWCPRSIPFISKSLNSQQLKLFKGTFWFLNPFLTKIILVWLQQNNNLNIVSFYIVLITIKLEKHRKSPSRKNPKPYIASFQEITVFKNWFGFDFFHLIYAYIFKTQWSLSINGILWDLTFDSSMWNAVEPCIKWCYICTGPACILLYILDHF